MAPTRLVLFITIFIFRSRRLLFYFTCLVQLVRLKQDDCCAQRLQLAPFAILPFFPLHAMRVSFLPANAGLPALTTTAAQAVVAAAPPAAAPIASVAVAPAPLAAAPVPSAAMLRAGSSNLSTAFFC
jgi:hypothetical protein